MSSFPLTDLPAVREMWLRGVSTRGIAARLCRSRADVQAIIDHNRSGQTWLDSRLELPIWIDAL